MSKLGRSEALVAQDFTVQGRRPTAAIIQELILSPTGLSIVYQPVIDLRSCATVGYEALARFEHSEVDDLGPDEWFAAARHVGLGAELDVRALTAAFSRRPDLPPNTFLSVNVDPQSLTDARVLRVLRQQGHLSGIVIEITEHERLDPAEADPVLRMLRRRGAVIAMDDAGAGHAGLQQILELRPSILKLDRSLVTDIDHDEEKTALVEMLAVFTRRIGNMWVLGEGVERIEEAHRLYELGVYLSQGFFFARPAPPWASLQPDTVTALRDKLKQRRETLFPMLEPTPPAESANLVSSDRLWQAPTPVVDDSGRPLGIRPHAQSPLESTTTVCVTEPPAVVARRLAITNHDLTKPVIVVDNAGKYLGTLNIHRVLAHLTEPKAHHDED